MTAEAQSLGSPSTTSRRSSRLARASRILPGLLSVVVVLIAWEIAGRQDPLFLSYPSAIWDAFIELAFTENRLLPALSSTVQGLTVGYVLAVIVGNVLGFMMARSKTLALVLDPYINALYATPRIAMVPLLVIWFGIDFQLRVAVVFLSVIFPVIIITETGAKHTETEYLDVARSFAATKRQALRTVVLPASLPFVMVGLRLGIVKALSGIIIAELTATVTGLGALIMESSRFFRTDRLFVPVIIIGLTSVLLTAAVYWAQRKTMPWASGDHRL